MLVISELFMGCVDPRVGSGWVDKSAICFGDYTLQGAVQVKYKGVRKIGVFRPISRFISKTVQDATIATMEDH